MTTLSIIDPVDEHHVGKEILDSGAPVAEVVTAFNQAWLIADVRGGTLRYSRRAPAAPAIGAPIQTVLPDEALRCLTAVAGYGQRLLDAADGSAEAFTAADADFRTAVADLTVTPTRMIRAVDARDWVADRYGTFGALARERGVTADTTDAELDVLAADEEVAAVHALPYHMTFIVGLDWHLHRIREGIRVTGAEQAAQIADQITALERARDVWVRRMAAWGQTNRAIAETVGLSHPTIAARRPGPPGMIQRIQARTAAGEWQTRTVGDTPATEMFMRHDDMLLVAPADGGEVHAVTDHGSVATGVWVHPKPAPMVQECSTGSQGVAPPRQKLGQ